jgi:hypothetical protein
MQRLPARRPAGRVVRYGASAALPAFSKPPAAAAAIRFRVPSGPKPRRFPLGQGRGPEGRTHLFPSPELGGKPPSSEGPTFETKPKLHPFAGPARSEAGPPLCPVRSALEASSLCVRLFMTGEPVTIRLAVHPETEISLRLAVRVWQEAGAPRIPLEPASAEASAVPIGVLPAEAFRSASPLPLERTPRAATGSSKPKLFRSLVSRPASLSGSLLDRFPGKRTSRVSGLPSSLQRAIPPHRAGLRQMSGPKARHRQDCPSDVVPASA